VRFLLVGPGRGVPSPQRLRPGSAGGALASQLDHDLRYLVHELHPVGDVELAPADDGAGARILDARVHSVLGYDVLVADVDVEFPAGAAAAEWETALSGIAAQVAAASGRSSLHELRWVGRYRLADDGDSRMPGWIGSDAASVTLHTDGDAVLVAGWANGRIEGWDRLALGEQWDTIAALVDAQVLWCQLDDVQRSARVELEELYLDPSSASLSGTSRALVAVNASAQFHNLCAGELVSGMQGRRRDVALGVLEIWRFEHLRERVNRDIESAIAHTEAMQRIRSGRYQRAVEGVLLALTLVSAIGLVLDFIAVAYINNSLRQPDAGPVDVPLLELFRTDADLILIIAAVLLLAVAIALLVLQWRRDRGARR
jgi:hypothetical protein